MNLTVTLGFKEINSLFFEGGSYGPNSEKRLCCLRNTIPRAAAGAEDRNENGSPLTNRKESEPDIDSIPFIKIITCKAQGPHNASREYVTEKRSLGLHFKTNGILSKDSLKLVAGYDPEKLREGVNQAAGIKDIGSRITGKSTKTKRTNEGRCFAGIANSHGRSLTTLLPFLDFRGGTVTPFKY